MQTLLVVFHLFLAMGLIGLILIQHGKGADAGAAFGSGASATVFGAQGSASFLTRATAVLATLFFLTSIAMGYLATQSDEPVGVMEGVQPAKVEESKGKVPAPQVPPASEVPMIPGTPNPQSAKAATHEQPSGEVPAVIPEPAEVPGTAGGN